MTTNPPDFPEQNDDEALALEENLNGGPTFPNFPDVRYASPVKQRQRTPQQILADTKDQIAELTRKENELLAMLERNAITFNAAMEDDFDPEKIRAARASICAALKSVREEIESLKKRICEIGDIIL